MPPGTESSSVMLMPALRQQNVGADDARHVVFERGRTLERDEFRRLAEIEPARDPFRLFAFGAFAVKQIDRAIKLQQHAAQRFNFLRQISPSGNGAGEMRQSSPANKPPGGSESRMNLACSAAFTNV